MSESATALLTSHVTAAMARFGWPGCAAALVRRSEPDVVRTWGLADVAAERRVTEDTGFRIGSTGKTLTALAVALLAEQGALDLGDRVDDHLSSIRLQTPDGNPVRLRHLASHTSGLGDLRAWRDVVAPRAGTGVRAGRSRPTLAELYADGLRTTLPPGVAWRYANHGISLLGAVIESVKGEDFGAAMDRLVLRPLGMRDTGFGTEWLDDPRTASGYTRARGVHKEVPPMDIAVAPAGSAVSRAPDMAAYLRALVGGGGHSEVAPVFEGMLRPLHQPDPRQTQTGTVWWVDRLDGHRVARHGGAWSGFRSCCLVAPDDGVALWLGVNADADLVEQVGLELFRAILGARPATVELAGRVAGSRPAAVPAGRYTPLGSSLYSLTTWSANRRGLRVRSSGGLTTLSGGGPWRAGVPLLPIGEDDPTLFGADAGAADPVNQGYTTVQVLGTAAQPMLVVNGRTPYVRSRSLRPWTPLARLAPESRDQLEQLCLTSP